MMLSIATEIRQHPSYIKLKRIIPAVAHISVPTVLEEIETLHMGRSTRTLSLKSMSNMTIVEAILQDQSYRSRITEIMFVALKTTNMLELAYTSTLDSLMSAYGDRLSQKTKGEREGYIKSFINPARKRIDEIYTIVSLAEYIIEDIDKASYALKNTIQALELTTKREYAA